MDQMIRVARTVPVFSPLSCVPMDLSQNHWFVPVWHRLWCCFRINNQRNMSRLSCHCWLVDYHKNNKQFTIQHEKWMLIWLHLINCHIVSQYLSWTICSLYKWCIPIIIRFISSLIIWYLIVLLRMKKIQDPVVRQDSRANYVFIWWFCDPSAVCLQGTWGLLMGDI